MTQLTLASVNPLDCATDVKFLFTSHGDGRFASWFDKAYPLATGQGATGWTGRSIDGSLKMYIARFDRDFLFEGAVVRGGNLNNMFVAHDARSFFPALALVRRAVRDSKREGAIDFLYGTPNDQFAPVSRTGGLQRVGVMARLVLPLGDAGAVKDVVLDVFHRARHATASTQRLAAEQYPAPEYDVRRCDAQATASGLVPLRPPAMYSYRLDGYPGDEYRWYEYRRSDIGEPIGTFLLRVPGNGVATLCAHRIYRPADIRTAIIDMAFRLRRLGYRRLQATALTTSPLYAILRGAGFFHRSLERELHAIGITERGKRAVAALSTADVEPIDCDQ